MKRNTLQTKANNRGFTLVEIIVVLVILAVLAAFTIPAMLGFVEDARGKAHIGEAREIYTVMQAALTESSAQTTETNKLTTTNYNYMYQIVNKKCIFSVNSIAKPSDLDIQVAKRATELINGDLNLGTNRQNQANITVDINTSKVKTVVLNNLGYTVTLDIEHGTTDVVKN